MSSSVNPPPSSPPPSPASPPPPGAAASAGSVSSYRNPTLDLSLTSVLRPEIALPLQQILNLYSVGNLLNAWRSPRNQRSIEQLFDSPQQARNAIATCATWLGVQMKPQVNPTMGWWVGEKRTDEG